MCEKISNDNTVKVSIVIPVYNEADCLAACLEAIARQTVRPYEVIVVDNNSSDGSAAIAGRYDFVRLVREPRQGVVHARNHGFDSARGDVIGRIDADTLLASDWVATVQTLFQNGQLDAVSGSVYYHDLPWRTFLHRLDLTFRQWIANGMGGDVYLYGSNMALRRSAWQKARQQMCLMGGLHEDFDLAIHLYDSGCQLAFDRQLQASVSLRRFNVALKDYWRYVWLSPQTYSQHGRRSQRRMYPVVLLVISAYFIIQGLYRCYDPASDTIALRNFWLLRSPLRVNPATYVD